MEGRDYIYASSRIRVFEKKLLKREQLQRLVQAGDEKNFLHLLQETDYGSYIQNVKRPEDFHKAMDSSWLYNLKEVLEMARDKEVVEVLAARYVYHNLKVLVKEEILGEDLSALLLELPAMDVDSIRNRLSREDKKEVPEAIYRALEDYEDKKDAQRIDLILDRAYYEEMLAKVEKLEDSFLTSFVVRSIDYSNAKALLRLKAQGLDYEALEDIYIPGGRIERESFNRLYKEEPGQVLESLGKEISDSTLKRARAVYEATGSLSAVEKLLEDALMDFTRDNRRVTYGPEVLFGFLLAKEREIMNLRMVYTSIIAGIAPEKIEERLRDSYV